MKIISFLFILTLVLSCGQRNPASSGQLLQVGAAYISLDEKLYEQQHAYSYSLCSALRSKRSNMLMSQIGSQVSFQISELDCHGIDYTHRVEAQITQIENLLMYKANYKKKYQSIVQTDQHGILASFCQKILSGKDFNDSVSNDHHVRLYPMPSSSSIRIELLEISDQQIKNMQSFEVDTNPQSEQYGVVVEYQESKQCLDKTKLYSFSQSLVL